MHEQFFKTLKKDHQEVKELIAQLEKTRGASQNREDLFKKLKLELKPHMEAEEHAFYPVLKKVGKKAEEDVKHGIEEHKEGDQVLTQLEKMPKDSEEWLTKLSELKEKTEHHIKEEESKIFKDAEALSHDQMKQIMESFEKEKEKVKSQLS